MLIFYRNLFLSWRIKNYDLIATDKILYLTKAAVNGQSYNMSNIYYRFKKQMKKRLAGTTHVSFSSIN